jgi:sulfite reductase (ferredoxin)
VLAAVKALLVTEGIDPATDAETLLEFERRLTDKQIVPVSYRNLGMQIGDLGPKETTSEFVQAKVAFARGFVEICKAATEQIGQSLKLKGEPVTALDGAAQAGADVSRDSKTRGSETAPPFDLRGVACPLNYVKTKLKLEMMEAGERLEVWLDAGEPIKNVPLSLRNDGHKILMEEPLGPDAAHFKILVEKVE